MLKPHTLPARSSFPSEINLLIIISLLLQNKHKGLSHIRRETAGQPWNQSDCGDVEQPGKCHRHGDVKSTLFVRLKITTSIPADRQPWSVGLVKTLMEHPHFRPVWRDVPFLYFIFRQLSPVGKVTTAVISCPQLHFLSETTWCLVPAFQLVWRLKSTQADF